MSYKKIKPTTMDELTMNVFMLLSEFNPTTFDFSVGIDGSKIIASTTGGVNFTDSPEYTDFGEDIDNCPKNTMELKRKKSGEVKLSGNLVTVNAALLKMLIGAATITGNKITPKTDISNSDFSTVWGIADYGNGGIIAIKMKRVLNTSGLSISTTDDSKAQFSFEFTCHRTIEDLTDEPYEIYIIFPIGVKLNKHTLNMVAGETERLVVTTFPEDATVSWGVLDERGDPTEAVTVVNGLVTAVSAVNATIYANITVDNQRYYDTCSVVVTAAS